MACPSVSISNCVNGVCFFCLKDSWKILKSGEEQNNSNCGVGVKIFRPHQFALQNLSTFLESYQHQGGGGGSGGHGDTNDKARRNCDLVVSTCDDCSKVTEEFTKLYQVLEVTKLKLNGCIQKMNELMSKAETEEDSIPKQKARTKDAFGKFRSETMGRLKEVTSLLPRTVLLQEVPDLTSVTLPPSVSTGSFVEPEPKVPKKKSRKQSFATKTYTAQIAGPVPTETVSMEDTTVKASKKKKRKAPNSDNKDEGQTKIAEGRRDSRDEPIILQKLTCPLCRGMFVNPDSLRRHLVQYHCHSYFPSQKLPSISDSEYQIILVELLFKPYLQGLSCQLCNEKFSGVRIPNQNQVKMHYITRHYEEVKNRLKDLQRHPQLEEMLATCNPKGKFCKCGVYLENGRCELRHKKLHCVYNWNRNYRESPFESAQSQMYEIARRKGLNYAHSHLFTTPPPPISTPVSAPTTAIPVKSRIKCKYCARVFTPRFMKTHLPICKKNFGKQSQTPAPEDLLDREDKPVVIKEEGEYESELILGK